MKNNERAITRRQFAGAAAATGVGALGLTSLVSGAASEAVAGEAAGGHDPVATYQTDVLVVGTGGSGLACAMESLEQGLKVLLIDKLSMIGGGTLGGIDALYGLGSRWSIESGETTTAAQVIEAELRTSQFRSDGAKWHKFITESGPNVDWLETHGTQVAAYSSIFEGYLSTHMFAQGALACCLEPLWNDILAAGGEYMLETTATELVMDDGVCTGIYATGPDGEIRIDAKAVVLCTGGYNANTELLAKAGWMLDNIVMTGMPATVGDGYRMAMAAGARDTIQETAPMIHIVNEAFDGRVWNDPVNGITGWGLMAPQIQVNQDGVRFTNEAYALENMLEAAVPLKENKKTYGLFNESVFLSMHAQNADAMAQYENALAGGKSIFKCDTIEECAEKVGLPADALKATFDRYNAMAANGVDEDFGKAPAFLVPIEAPIVIAEYKIGYIVSMGGVGTDINCQAVDANRNAIPGLYVGGVDGMSLYRNIYNISIPGGAFAHSIWSGRTIGRAIAASLA